MEKKEKFKELERRAVMQKKFILWFIDNRNWGRHASRWQRLNKEIAELQLVIQGLNNGDRKISQKAIQELTYWIKLIDNEIKWLNERNKNIYNKEKEVWKNYDTSSYDIVITRGY